MYFNSTQVTILVHVTLYTTDAADNAEGMASLVRETHYYISDVRQGARYFVRATLSPTTLAVVYIE